MSEVKSVTQLRTGGSLGAIYPQTFDDVVRFARMAVKAGLFAQTQRRGKSGSDAGDDQDEAQSAEEKAVAQATMCVLHGMELEIPPLQALAGIAIISGRPCIYGDLVPAVLWSKGFELEEEVTGEDDTLKAVVTVIRPNGKRITREFTAKDAQRAGLWDAKATVKRKVWRAGKLDWFDVPNDSPWFCYRKRMVQMRARGFAVDDGAADVMRGMRLREAMEDMERLERRAPVPEHQDIPDIPQAAAIEDQHSTVEVLQDSIPLSPAETIEALRIALEGAKTIQDASDAWNELAEDIEALDGAARDKIEQIYNIRLDQIEGVGEYQISEKQVIARKEPVSMEIPDV